MAAPQPFPLSTACFWSNELNSVERRRRVGTYLGNYPAATHPSPSMFEERVAVLRWDRGLRLLGPDEFLWWINFR